MLKDSAASSDYRIREALRGHTYVSTVNRKGMGDEVGGPEVSQLTLRELSGANERGCNCSPKAKSRKEVAGPRHQPADR